MSEGKIYTREELDALKQHKVRSRAVELGFPHTKSLGTSKEKLIDFVLRKQNSDGEDVGEDSAEEATPSKEERAEKRAKAGVAKGAKKGPPKPKGGKKAPPKAKGNKKAAAKPKVEAAPDAPVSAATEDAGAIVELLDAMQTSIKDLIKRVDNMASGVGEGLEALGEGQAALNDRLVTLEGYSYVIGCVTEAIPEDTAEEGVEAAATMVRSYLGEDESGN